MASHKDMGKSTCSLLKIPEDSDKEKQVAQTWSEAMISKEHSTSSKEASKKIEKRTIDFEANPKGEPRYLPP